MSESNLTPQTAPRTLEGLMSETPFKLRLLLTDLGGLQTEEQKMGWHQLSTPEMRAQHVLAVLKNWDQANPGVAQPPPPPMQQPMNGQMNGTHVPQQQMPQQPPMQQPMGLTGSGAAQGFMPPQGFPVQGFQMPGQVPGFVAPQPVMPVPAGTVMAPGAPPMVSQQAAQAAAAATQSETPKKGGKRSPTNNGVDAGTGAAAPADLGAQVLSMLQTVLQGLGNEANNRMAWQKQITDMLEEAASSKASRVTALESKYGELATALHSLSEALQTQQRLQIWTLMAFLTLAEQQTGASVVQILGTAISDSAMFNKFVDQATGKS